LMGCRMDRANLRSARLAGANLENAELSDCDLSGADLTDTVLTASDLDHARKAGADLSKILTEKRAGRSSNELDWPIEFILGQHAQWVESEGREGGAADLGDVDLRECATLAGRALMGLIAPRAILHSVDMEGALLQGSNLRGADLRCAKLARADLRGADLTGA